MGRAFFYLWLVLIGAAAIVVPAWLVLTPPEPQPSVTTPAVAPEKIAALQAMAESSCRCERAARGKGAASDCWRRFDGAAGRSHEEMGESYCDPISPRMLNLPGDGSDGFDIVIRYDIGDGHYFCSKDEAHEATELFERKMTEADEKSAYSAIARLADEYARGRKPRALSASTGCGN